MIKITGNLPHPTKKGFSVRSPYLFVTPTLKKDCIDIVIEAFLTLEDIEAQNSIGGEKYNFKPIPYFIYKATNIETQASVFCVSIAEIMQDINTIQMGNTHKMIGYTNTGESIVIAENGEIFYILEKVDIRATDNKTTNVVDKLLYYCCEFIVAEINHSHSDLVQANLLSSEIVL